MTGPRGFHWSFYAFFPFTAAMLFLDSQWLVDRGFNGQILANLLVPIYFGAMIVTIPDRRLRRIMLITVPISAVGELIFAQGAELYTYKFGMVPLYVPFGHAIVVGSGFQLLWHPWIKRPGAIMIHGLLLGYLGMFLLAFFVLDDNFTLFLGLLYFVGIFSMRERAIYLFMPFFILFVEFVGTAFGCWAWHPLPFGFFSTVNPPTGSIMFYVYLDMAVMLMARFGYEFLPAFAKQNTN